MFNVFITISFHYNYRRDKDSPMYDKNYIDINAMVTSNLILLLKRIS